METKTCQLFYADDDADDAEIFKTAVKRIREKNNVDIDLHMYETGDALLHDVMQRKPANGIVFLDINMPGKNGFEVLSDIRREPSVSDLPVIMYSTSFESSTITTSRLMGASMYAVKPSDFAELQELIMKVVAIDWKGFVPERDNFLIGRKTA